MKSDKKLKQALEELMEEDLYGMPFDSPFESTYSFSEESDSTIEKLYNNMKPKYPQKFYYKQILSAAACILLLCSCVLGGFQLLYGLNATNSCSPGSAIEPSSGNDLLTSEADELFIKLLLNFNFAKADLEIYSLEAEPYNGNTQTFTEIVESETELEAHYYTENDAENAKAAAAEIENAKAETIPQYLHFSNTEQISNLVYYCIYEEDIEESNFELERTSNTLLHTEFSDYQDEDIIQVDVCPDEMVFIYVALANCITEGFEEDDYTQIYYQGLLSITGNEDSNDFQVNLPFSNSVSTDEHPYVTLCINNWVNSYSQNYTIALNPADDPDAGTIYLPVTSNSGETTWFDYTPGIYLLSAEATTTSEFFSGILIINTDGEISFKAEKYTSYK